jgi:hypothetical protein
MNYFINLYEFKDLEEEAKKEASKYLLKDRFKASKALSIEHEANFYLWSRSGKKNMYKEYLKTWAEETQEDEVLNYLEARPISKL